MKYLFTNQNFHKSKLLLFCDFNFLKKDIYVKGTLQIFDIIFNNLIGPNILQLVFDFIAYSIVALYDFLFFSEACSSASANNLQT